MLPTIVTVSEPQSSPNTVEPDTERWVSTWTLDAVKCARSVMLIIEALLAVILVTSILTTLDPVPSYNFRY